ncbi:MAG: SlyX family protein [Pirellula sp.]|nr:SlyX family protein [Pirellula sp.]
MTSQESRLTELETLFTHMQRTIQDLDQVVVEQARRIDLLEREMRLLTSDLRTLRDAYREPRRPEDEVPPHY